MRKLGKVPGELGHALKTHKIGSLNLPNIQGMLLPSVGVVLLLQVCYLLQRRLRLEQTFDRSPLAIRWGVYYAAMCVLFYFGVYDQHRFIYFQF